MKLSAIYYIFHNYNGDLTFCGFPFVFDHYTFNLQNITYSPWGLLTSVHLVRNTDLTHSTIAGRLCNNLRYICVKAVVSNRLNSPTSNSFLSLTDNTVFDGLAVTQEVHSRGKTARLDLIALSCLWRCHSSLHMFRSMFGACEKVANDLELAGGFARYSCFPHHLQLANYEWSS